MKFIDRVKIHIKAGKGGDGITAVSYTHLDVYKRQQQDTEWEYDNAYDF